MELPSSSTAGSTSSTSTATAELPEKPHQPPGFKFPPRSFGKKKVVHRAFQASWFQSWPWIHYDEGRDHVLCYYCCKALKQKYLSSTTLGASDGAIVSVHFFFFFTLIVLIYSQLPKGFSNWKDGTIGFRQHESASCHKIAVETLFTLPATTPNVGEMLCRNLASEK